MLNRCSCLKLSRNRESAELKVLYFVESDQKCGTKFSTCCTYWWQEKKTILPRWSSGTFFKKKKQKQKNLRIRTDSIPQRVFLRLLPCILQRTQNNNSVGIQFYRFPNHVSCQILSEKRLKCLLLSKWFFKCISSAFPLRIWRQYKFEEMKLKQLKICCSLRQSSKTASSLNLHRMSET